VQTYRSTYTTIPKAWWSADAAIKKGGVPLGRLGLELAGERIHLPNGMSLHYPELRAEDDGQWRYTGRRGREPLYGGKIIENVIQALARIVVMTQQLAIAREFRVVFSVHDEVVCCVPDEAAETCKARLLNLMAMPPEWAPDLPLACEAAVGKNFGEL
jgi:DNA polymerase